MSLIRYQPFGHLNRFHRDLDRLFETRLGQPLAQDDDVHTTVTDWLPAVDIREEEDRFVLRADIPGVDSKAIEITMENGVLTIRGERGEENRENDKGHTRIERVSGQFYRRFNLPETSNSDDISASSKNGVLEIVVPKQLKPQPRRITVDAA